MKKLLFSFLVLISSRNYSQLNTIKKDSILINNYLKLQKKTNNSDILVIKDEKWVNLIVKYNNQKQREVNNIISEKFKKKSVSERFGENDINAGSEIIEIIKQGNNDSINRLFADLKVYYNSDKPKNINSELKTLLFESINNPNLEVSTSFLISHLKLEGFEQVLQNKLFSNTSKNESVLFNCLVSSHYCSDYCDDSTELIEYFFNKLSDMTIEEIISNPNLANALTSSAFLRAENSKGRKRINDLFFRLLDNYPLKNIDIQNDYNILPDGKSIFYNDYSFYSVKGIISFLAFNGDSRIVPILNKLEGLGMKHTIQLDFLYWKYDYDKSEKTFDMLLSDREYYFKMIYELDKKNIIK